MNFISPWIHTTEMCNLNCHYCYVKGKAIMTEEVYQGLEQLLLKADTSRRHLRFAGGEPLLVFDKWRDFSLRMLKHEGTTVEVLTSLTTVPDSFWQYIDNPNINVSVSIDNGLKVKKLDQTIVDKLKRIRNPWILTTITMENLSRLDNLATLVGSNNYGWALTTDYFESNNIPCSLLAPKLVEVIRILKKFNYDFKRISFNNCSINPNFTGCRAGREMFAVACNGDIYRCQTQIGTNKKIGDVFSGYKKTSIRRKRNCAVCAGNQWCSGWCPLYFKLPNPLCYAIKVFNCLVLNEVNKNAI